MKRRSDFKVDIVGPVGSMQDVVVSIRVKDFNMGTTSEFPVRFGVYVADVLIATCDSSKALADWCWKQSPKEVAFNFNLKLAANEA